MGVVRHLVMRSAWDADDRPSSPLAAMPGDGSQHAHSRRGNWDARQVGWAGRSRALWKGLLTTAILGPLLTLVACGTTAQIPNPPAHVLTIAVSVFDHETVNHTPSDKTLLAINLSRVTPGGDSSETVEGTDAETLKCDGVTMQFVSTNDVTNANNAISGTYAGSVPPQTSQYTCTYFWGQGTQQALLTIPVMIPNVPHIQSPASRAMLHVPVTGDRGVALSYAPAGNDNVTVTATASDYDKRTASFDQQSDSGSVVIDGQRFPQVFSVGWGTLSLTRSLNLSFTGLADIGKVDTNSTFAAVELRQYEQADQIPIFWV